MNPPASQTSAERDPGVIGVVCALPLESGPFVALCQRYRTHAGKKFRFHGLMLKGRKIVLVECGMGMARAGQATQALIDGHHPQWVLSAGLSGALVPDLAIGDLVLGTEVLPADGGRGLTIDVHAAPSPGSVWRTGKLCCATHIVRTVVEKQQLAAATGALAVDLETLAVARACAERNTRCLIVRAISDDLQTDLPVEALAVLGPKGTVRAGALLQSLINRPGCVKDLWTLRTNSQLAAQNLARFLAAAIPQLPLGDAIP